MLRYAKAIFAYTEFNKELIYESCVAYFVFVR